MWATLALKAQTVVPNDSVQLQEVVVRGARVVNRTDGKMIFPFGGDDQVGDFRLQPLEDAATAKRESR